jgi:hypothetical protein
VRSRVPGRGDFTCHRASGVVLDVTDHDVHPRVCQLEGDRASDAAPASSDHRGLACQVVHQVLV